MLRACCLTAVLLFAACASPGAGLPVLADAAVGAYRLGPGDQVRIITFSDDQLTGDFRVNDSGTIALPLVGSVPAAGHTTTEVETTIAEALQRANLFRNPSVSVEVVAYRPIFILGEVSKPGQYPYQPGMTVLTAVSIAGGFTYRAVHDTVSILRTGDGSAIEGQASRMSFVQPGDVITVYERRF